MVPLPLSGLLRGAWWAGGLTLWADVRLPHVCAYRDNVDKDAAGKGDPPLGSQPVALHPIPSPPEPPHSTSRDLADPVQLRLTLQGHPLQGGQVEHCTAPDVVIIVPAPVKIMVRELKTEVRVGEGPEARGAG